MKTFNKFLIICGILCVLSVTFLVYSIQKNVKDNKSTITEEIRHSVPKSDPVQNNISEPLDNRQIQEKYFLKIDGNRICAYILADDGTQSLWNTIDIPPALSDEDRAILNEGIVTDSFERLCLYMESYSS